MNVQFSKWGNSIAVRIPAGVLKDVGIGEGGRADLVVENGRIVLSPISPRRRYSLEELISGISEENRHDVFEFGPPVGCEVW